MNREQTKEWRQRVKRQLAPANVLKLIRDGKVTSVAELQGIMGFNDLARRHSDRYLFEDRLKQILDSLTAADLVRREKDKLIPTELIERIQKALEISLTELSEFAARGDPGDVFVAVEVIDALRQCRNTKYDIAKVVRFCEELNSSFAAGNYLASILLIRALLNHVPPVFGQNTFQQVVSQTARSVRELLKPLEEIARDVADLHTHALIRHKENLPTKNQVEPFKANVEVLLHEVIAKLQEQA